MDSPAIDALNATKTIHYLITPYTEWDAYRLGIIDKSGNQMKITTTPQEKTAFNLFHRMIVKLRKYLDRTPGYNKYLKAWNAGQELTGVKVSSFAISNWSPANHSMLPVTAASYHTMRECVEEGITDECGIAAKFDEKYRSMSESDLRLFEDGVMAGTSTASVGPAPNIGDPSNMVIKKKPLIIRRKNVPTAIK